MQYFKISNFKKLDKIFYKILISKYANWRTYCISCLQFIKPHPEYFIKYNYFFSNRLLLLIIIIFRCLPNLFFRISKWFLRKSEDFFYKCLNTKNNNFKEKKTDILIFTSLVNANTLNSRKNSNNDFIFGNIIRDLRQKYNVKIVYLNLTRINSRKLFDIFKKNDEIFILDKILSIKDELTLLKNQFIELINFLINFSIKQIGFQNYILILINIFSFETRNNFRLRFQIKKIIKKVKPQIVTLSYEGNCWEKCVFNVCESLNDKNYCKTVGYQHAGIMKSQTIINHKYKKDFNPDFVLTSGKHNMKYFSKFFKKNKLFEIGSNRFVNNFEKNYNKKIENKKKNILILPEGTFEETKILFDLSSKLANQFRDKNFILRTHPQINMRSFLKKYFIFERYKNLSNLIISKRSFDQDLNRATFVIYRGSTGIITAILKGLIPLYYKQINEELNLDPVFDLKKYKFITSSLNDFKNIFYSKNNMKNEYYTAKLFCSNYFTPQKSLKTQRIFKLIMNYNKIST